MRTVHEKFEKFKLDDKEYALYTSLLVISNGRVILVLIFLKLNLVLTLMIYF